MQKSRLAEVAKMFPKGAAQVHQDSNSVFVSIPGQTSVLFSLELLAKSSFDMFIRSYDLPDEYRIPIRALIVEVAPTAFMLTEALDLVGKYSHNLRIVNIKVGPDHQFTISSRTEKNGIGAVYTFDGPNRFQASCVRSQVLPEEAEAREALTNFIIKWLPVLIPDFRGHLKYAKASPVPVKVVLAPQ